MIVFEDDEFEGLVTTSDRVSELGFRPQKEMLINHLLPYANELDVESNKFLEQVKNNLAKSIMLREIKPACGVWTSRLMKYIRLYGLKFGKEDHIALIKLAYELMLIPDLEPCKIHKFATMFLMLTKKRHLISPSELTLAWRPLYEMGQKIFDKSASYIGMYHYLSSLESSYMTMVKCARPYFDVNATKEILAEILPRINPWEPGIICQLAVFLPLSLPPHQAAYGHELWFDKMMTLWDVCHNVSSGIPDLIILFAGIAKRNPGSVDWAPYVPKLFTRFLHALNLPVSYKDMQVTKAQSLETKHIASWIVWTINPDGVVLKHLRCFIATIESYLHSANSGRWSYKLRDLLKKLAREFLNRVRREREKRFQDTWENKTPDAYKLREEDITEFVNITVEPTLQAVYSRSGSSDVELALHNLAVLRPAAVVPLLLDKFRSSITSLTEPHRATAAISALVAVARPMLLGAHAGYPEGPTRVIPCLMSILPGIDPNDVKKTFVSLHFILIFSWMIPIVDCSAAAEHWPDLTEEERLTCEQTAQFEDFVLLFLDRIFCLVDSSAFENVRLDADGPELARSKTDAIVESAIASATMAVVMQSSPKIFAEALRKFKSFATESTFETKVSGSIVGMILRVFAHVDSEATLAAFVPKLCEELRELLSTDEILKDENPPRELTYRLMLLRDALEADGTVILKHVPDITSVLDRALLLENVQAYTYACEIISNALVSFSSVELMEWRSSPKEYGRAPEAWLPVREWGHGCLTKNAALKWHVPSAAEAACAQQLLERYLQPQLDLLQGWLDGAPLTKEQRLKALAVVHASLACNSFLPQPTDEPFVELIPTNVAPTFIPMTTGVSHSVTLGGKNVRQTLAAFMSAVQNRLLAEQSDGTKVLEMLLLVWGRIVVYKSSRNCVSLEMRLRSYSSLERATDGRSGRAGGSATVRLRMLVCEAARMQDDSRPDLVCEAGIRPYALTALNAMFDLSINMYSSIRMPAQARLYWMLGHYPYSYRLLLPRIQQVLTAGGEGEEWHARHKGVLYVLLGPRTGPLISKQDWPLVRALWPLALRAPLSEKPSILRLEHAFSDTLHRSFPSVNTRLKFQQSAVDAAAPLLEEDQLKDPQFAALLEKAEEMETALSDQAEAAYLGLIDELVEAAEAPNVQWRRLELAMQMLSYCPSVQTPFPPRAIQLIMRSLVHDDITVRRSAQKLAHFALKQLKRKQKKIKVDPYEVAGVPRPEVKVPGYRKDLEWAIWSADKVPKTDEDWERPWLKNIHIGFYEWPDKIEVAAPSYEQKCSSRMSYEELTEGEKCVYDFFIDDANVDKLISFLTVEEKKGKDKFNGIRMCVFKALFGQFGEKVADKYLAHALRCAASPQESQQRFAAEVAAAALRAPRYWPRAPALRLYNAALQIITAGLTSVTVETMEDWGSCVATGVEKMDPWRGGEFLAGLARLCVPADARTAEPDVQTTFVACARLFAFQGALSALKWRAAPLAADLLQRLEASNFTQHPYQNVRDTVGSILMTIFDTCVVFPGGQRGPAPSLAAFLETVRPRLAALYDEHGDLVIKAATPGEQCGGAAGALSGAAPAPAARTAPFVSVQVGARRHSREAPLDEDAPRPTEPAESEPEAAGGSLPRVDKELVTRMQSALQLAGDAPAPRPPEEHARALNLLTTVLRGCMSLIVRGVSAQTECHYSVVRVACGCVGRGSAADELPRAAGALLASIALAYHEPQAFDTALTVLEQMAKGNSWWSRLACLQLAQPLVLYARPLQCAEPRRAARAETFALQLMRDPRLEVRQAAAKLLTGLMHLNALPDEDKTLKSLMQSCRSRELVERHCGVLGLCAYVSSQPYGLGPRIGAVLGELARHTSAPDPVPSTIRTALADFRRTHQDDWPAHRDQLTEEELDLLADLTSPPSYCA